jgi:hypothetical protein
MRGGGMSGKTKRAAIAICSFSLMGAFVCFQVMGGAPNDGGKNPPSNNQKVIMSGSKSAGGAPIVPSKPQPQAPTPADQQKVMGQSSKSAPIRVVPAPTPASAPASAPSTTPASQPGSQPATQAVGAADPVKGKQQI